MSVQEIYELEKRDGTNLYDIHFYMEGAFWRAYEWSAYLSKNFPSELHEDERLKAIKRIAKDNKNEFVQVGLQLSSFEKYFPKVADDESIFVMDDKHIIIHANKFFEGEDFSDYENVLNFWKDSIKLTNNEKKKCRDKLANSDTDGKNVSYDSLINDIVCYPIETKNLVECLQFLSHIRDNAIKLKKNRVNS